MSRTPQPRPNVLAIPPYVAGKPPQLRPGVTSYKLSSNENPYPPLPGVQIGGVSLLQFLRPAELRWILVGERHVGERVILLDMNGAPVG